MKIHQGGTFLETPKVFYGAFAIQKVICNFKKMLQFKKAVLPLILSLCNSTEFFYPTYFVLKLGDGASM